ncbi:uncharacterized protein N7511_011516 [Penicillium nucicola]|uniref:uncharacterized protein n=1 Tax=Penicillium nucicola TaxID=1850975 RepID=UPI0025451B73|nr:uncharacterized protein N7511_011516 [Penicillium nucicola]KAJ5742497.1 hypothetical protein N7511_011516 [Penicillium nucicola]
MVARGIIIGSFRLPGRKMGTDSYRCRRIIQSGSGIRHRSVRSSISARLISDLIKSTSIIFTRSWVHTVHPLVLSRPHLTAQPPSQNEYEYGLNDDHSWITYKRVNHLHRWANPSLFVISAKTLAIGFSGNVIVLALSEQ